MLSENAQLWVSALIGVLFVSIVYLLSPVYHFQPKGLLLPAQAALAPTKSEDVAILDGNTNASSAMQKLGRVSVQQQWTKKNARMVPSSLLAKARQLAARVGANAIVVTRVGNTRPYVPEPDQAYWLLQGKAVKINVPLLPLEPGIVLPENK